jgi:hypothetical protein
MTDEKLAAGINLKKGINTLIQILTAIETIFGLTPEQKASAKAEIQGHKDTLQKQLDAL